jgi:hypothetical protein
MAKKIETRVPTCWDELFPGRFLKACDLKGKEVTITIKRVYQEKIDGKWKLIFEFPEGQDKHEMACNRTNGEFAGAMFGKDPTKWVGHKITIRSEVVWAFGEKTNALRICGSPELSKEVVIDIDMGRSQIRGTMRPTKRNGNGSKA